jgi:hypothetical protein
VSDPFDRSPPGVARLADTLVAATVAEALGFGAGVLDAVLVGLGVAFVELIEAT